MDTLFETDNMINIISNKSNNQFNDCIMNMTVLTKNHEFFHIYLEFAGLLKLNAYDFVIWIFEKMTYLKNNYLEKIKSIIIDIYNL